jgi:hypothetical protein
MLLPVRGAGRRLQPIADVLYAVLDPRIRYA